MGWVRDSDRVLDDDALWEADVIGYALWSASVRVCAAKDEGAGGDGLLSPRDIHTSLHRFKTAIKRDVADTLVQLGLWHDEDGLRACAPCREWCPKLPSPEHRFIHDWKDHLLDSRGKRDKAFAELEKARRWLRDTDEGRKRAKAVRDRDRDECQYCGIPVRFEDRKAGDRRSKDLGELDHVNPFLPTAAELNAKDNLCVACKECNGGKSGKRRQTPEQWAAAGGRLLRSALGATTPATWVDHRSDPDRSGSITDPIADPGSIDPDANGDPPRVARDSGPGPDPNRADPGSGPRDQGSDLVGVERG